MCHSNEVHCITFVYLASFWAFNHCPLQITFALKFATSKSVAVSMATRLFSFKLCRDNKSLETESNVAMWNTSGFVVTNCSEKAFWSMQWLNSCSILAYKSSFTFLEVMKLMFWFIVYIKKLCEKEKIMKNFILKSLFTSNVLLLYVLHWLIIVLPLQCVRIWRTNYDNITVVNRCKTYKIIIRSALN